MHYLYYGVKTNITVFIYIFTPLIKLFIYRSIVTFLFFYLYVAFVLNLIRIH